MKAYQARNGATQYKPSLSSIEDIIRSDNSTGFCLGCGAEQDGVEPDARKYVCEGCGAAKVYGAEQLLVMGLYHDTEDGA